MKKDPARNVNMHTSREAWLRAATDALRPLFLKHGYTLPEKIRFAIAFTSGGSRGMPGECWHPESSADQSYEIIIKGDKDKPLEVLGILVHELVHSLLPLTVKHGKAFRDIALRIGLEGKMKHAMPAKHLQEQLATIAANLGPLPHAKLDYKARSDRPKKSGAGYVKAECAAACGYTIRLIPKWIKVGLPICPVDKNHGHLKCELPKNPDEMTDDQVAP